MKKLLYLLGSAGLGAVIAVYVFHALHSTAFLRTHGREGTLVIEQRYADSRWSRPFPFKRIHAYTAILEPRHEVIVESDQALNNNTGYAILFLTRDKASEARRAFLRPIPGLIRLRTSDDPTPPPKDPTEPLNRLLTKAMGDPAATHAAQVFSTTPLSDTQNSSVFFLIAAPGDNFIQILWANSRPGEWAFVLGLALLFIALGKYAWRLPWKPEVPLADRKDFVHPSLRVIDPDPPAPTRPRVEFTPSEPEDASPSAPPPRPDDDPPLKLPRR